MVKEILPELARVVAMWRRLPDHIREVIWALVGVPEANKDLNLMNGLRDHLRRAWNWLMGDGPPGFPAALAGDFETALGALEVEGKEQSAVREFWEEMRMAAEARGLHDHAFRYRRLAGAALSLRESFLQQQEAEEEPEDPAWYEAARVVEKDPEHGWELILTLVPIATDNSLTFIAVGPLGSLLKGHGEDYIDRIEARAAEDRRFRECLSRAQIFEEDCPPGMIRRLEKLGIRILRSGGDGLACT
jgi:hypothetical protein